MTGWAASFDTDGFEGPASNFNRDCDAGPDCATSLDLSGLTNGVRYYVVLSATNTSGRESAPTAEVSAVPHRFEGIAPPRSISDLRLSRSGSNVVLEWSRPLVDIYGRPATVVGYRVYRGEIPSFQPSPGSLIAAIGDGAITTFTDAGAAVDPRNFFCLVTAEDATGYLSGAGRELPNGIEDLAVSSPAPDTVRLTWSAVFTDVMGFPTLIDHHEVHATSIPVGRGSLGPSTIRLGNVTSIPVNSPLTDVRSFISVIAVGNRGNRSPF